MRHNLIASPSAIPLFDHTVVQKLIEDAVCLNRAAARNCFRPLVQT